MKGYHVWRGSGSEGFPGKGETRTRRSRGAAGRPARTPHKTSSQRRLLLASPPPLPPPPPTPPLAPRSGCDANACRDGSFGGRSSRDEYPLDPSPSPRSQLGPTTPVIPYCWADIRLPWWKRSGSLRVSSSENLYINPPSPFLDSAHNEGFFFPFRVRFFVTLPSFSDGRIVLFQLVL